MHLCKSTNKHGAWGVRCNCGTEDVIAIFVLNPASHKTISIIWNKCGRLYCSSASRMRLLAIHDQTSRNRTVIYHSSAVLLRFKQFSVATSIWESPGPQISTGLPLLAIFHLIHLPLLAANQRVLMSPIISWAFEMHELLLEVTAQ